MGGRVADAHRWRRRLDRLGARVTMTARDPNNAALRPQTLPDQAHAARKLNEIIDMANKAKGDLAELWQRAEQTSEADGYPASSMGPAVQAEAELTSVESAAETRAFGRDMPDDVLSAVAQFEANVDKAHGALRAAEHRRQFVFAVEEVARQRRSSVGECLACERTVQGTIVDKLKSGFCWRAKRQTYDVPGEARQPGLDESDRSGCYDAWLRWQDRNRDLENLSVAERRARFIAERQDFLAQQALEAEARRREQRKR